jgi:UDP-2-acetamido-2,6-beta-L-arabino-hexul-4-ose reductase
MIKIGITGQSGFIGSHLFNTLGFFGNSFTRIPFEDSYFLNDEMLLSFVKDCDVIVHLAAVNRHKDLKVIYQTNIGLVQQLIAACEATKSTPNILFSSSIQEGRDNIYGKSKKDGRELFEQWAKRNNAKFTSLVIPNVYGPFGKPFHNSVVATFCYQLTHNITPIIENDAEIKLIYIGELIHQIIACITTFYSEKITVRKIFVEHTTTIKVSELFYRLTTFKEDYLEKGILPDIKNPFNRNLFNTFMCYIDHDMFFPFKLKINKDNRGSYIETMKSKSGSQVSFSITSPGITRGNHFHTRKAERFVVIKGKARIDFRRIGTDRVISFNLNGDEPSFVDIPIWYVHNITNTGKMELCTLFWISEFYDPNDPDTYSDNV